MNFDAQEFRGGDNVINCAAICSINSSEQINYSLPPFIEFERVPKIVAIISVVTVQTPFLSPV